MSLLDRYIVRAILGSVTLVLVVLLILGSLFLFIEQQDDIGVGHYTSLQAFWYVLLNLPKLAWQVLPIAALIGSLLGLGTLARGSEITVIRATGMSPWRIAGAAGVAALLLMGLQIGLGEFLASPLQLAAQQQKATAKYGDDSNSGGGAWVRDGDLILNVTHQSGERQFGGMLLFELSPDHRLQAIGHAVRADAKSKQTWLLSGYAESRFTSDRVLAHSGRPRVLDSTVSAGFLGLAAAWPLDLEVAELWKLMGYLKSNELDVKPYQFAFWSRIARVVALVFAVLLAIPFVLGSLRAAGAGARTVVGLLIGIGFFLLQRLIESGTLVFDLNPLLLAWMPTVLLATLTSALLIRASR